MSRFKFSTKNRSKSCNELLSSKTLQPLPKGCSDDLFLCDLDIDVPTYSKSGKIFAHSVTITHKSVLILEISVHRSTPSHSFHSLLITTKTIRYPETRPRVHSLAKTTYHLVSSLFIGCLREDFSNSFSCEAELRLFS